MKRPNVFVTMALAVLMASVLLVACTPRTDPGTNDRNPPDMQSQPGQESGDGAAMPEEPRPARDPENGVFQGYGNDRLAEIRYDARYLFEQYAIPRDLIDYKAQIIQSVVDSDSRALETALHTTWLNTAAEAAVDDFDKEEREVFDSRPFEERKELIDKKLFEYGLDKNQIAGLTIETLDRDSSAAIVELVDTGWRPLSTYLAIVHNDEAGLRYFTLERSYGDKEDGSDDPYMFCWVELGSRGSLNLVDNTKEAFVEAIMLEMQAK